MDERVNELLGYGKMLISMSDEMVLTREKTELIDVLRRELGLLGQQKQEFNMSNNNGNLEITFKLICKTWDGGVKGSVVGNEYFNEEAIESYLDHYEAHYAVIEKMYHRGAYTTS